MKRKLRVVLSGLIYPFTMLHFFWRALQRRDDVDLLVAGAFTGTWIPWNNGMNLPEKYVMYPDIQLPKETISMRGVPSAFIENQLPENFKNPHLWLQVDAGWHLKDKPKATVVAHVQTDPHVLKEHYRLPKSYSDYNFCMQRAYIADGEFYLPYAYDPTIHYSMPEVEKKYDVCMIGLNYDHRQKLVNQLRAKGVSVYHSIGEVYDEYRLRYNESRIAVSWSSLQDTPSRVFEAFGFGLPLVANRTPDLPTFFVDGEHYLGFNTTEEAVFQVMRLLSDDDLRMEIADAGHRKAEAGHKWDYRINQILEVCKLK